MNRRILACLICIVGLSGCTVRNSLHSARPDVIQGTLIGGLAEQPRVEVTMNGKTYVGPWWTSLPSRELLDSVGRVHRRHMRIIHAEPKSSDDEQLICEWILHGVTGTGTCKTATDEYRLDVR